MIVTNVMIGSTIWELYVLNYVTNHQGIWVSICKKEDARNKQTSTRWGENENEMRWTHIHLSSSGLKKVKLIDTVMIILYVILYIK